MGRIPPSHGPHKSGRNTDHENSYIPSTQINSSHFVRRLLYIFILHNMLQTPLYSSTCQEKTSSNKQTRDTQELHLRQQQTPPTSSLLPSVKSPVSLKVASMFAQICNAMATCYAAGVFHRDIKSGSEAYGFQAINEGREVFGYGWSCSSIF
jgi:hypothetical protein